MSMEKVVFEQQNVEQRMKNIEGIHFCGTKCLVRHSYLQIRRCKNIILATTTSTQDSGLLDALIPVFEKITGYIVMIGDVPPVVVSRCGDARTLRTKCRLWMDQLRDRQLRHYHCWDRVRVAASVPLHASPAL